MIITTEDTEEEIHVLMQFQIAKAFASVSSVRLLPKPPSGGFPEGLLDRAFYARVCVRVISKPVSTGLKSGGTQR
jgi:hypothetical protein